jgi:hypothetical protein
LPLLSDHRLTAATACFVVALAAATPALAAPGKHIAAASGSGHYYAGASLSREIRHPRKMWAVVSIVPSATGKLDYNVSCERGLDFDYESGDKTLADGAVFKLPRPLRRPQSCDVSLTWSYENFDVDDPPERTVRVELRATKRRD